MNAYILCQRFVMPLEVCNYCLISMWSSRWNVFCVSTKLCIFLTVYSMDSSVGGLECLPHLFLPGGWRTVKGKIDTLFWGHTGGSYSHFGVYGILMTLHNNLMVPFVISLWSVQNIYWDVFVPVAFCYSAYLKCLNVKYNNRLSFLKPSGVIMYSHLCCLKPVWLFF